MKFGERVIKGWEMTGAGYTAVWATGNTREELWDAMKRRETYATSGPRMAVRFFGGYDFTADDISRSPAVAGYAKGVPMGGDLPAAPAGKAPTFLVAALKDPKTGNLDRIQIIKGWLDKAGKPQEKIYDVVWGDAERRKIVKGKLSPSAAPWTSPAPPGPTRSATRSSSAVWKDPGLRSVGAGLLLRSRAGDPDAALDRLRRGVLQGEDRRSNVPMVTQERAFTSPIWYTPEVISQQAAARAGPAFPADRRRAVRGLRPGRAIAVRRRPHRREPGDRRQTSPAQYEARWCRPPGEEELLEAHRGTRARRDPLPRRRGPRARPRRPGDQAPRAAEAGGDCRGTARRAMRRPTHELAGVPGPRTPSNSAGRARSSFEQILFARDGDDCGSGRGEAMAAAARGSSPPASASHPCCRRVWTPQHSTSSRATSARSSRRRS